MDSSSSTTAINIVEERRECQMKVIRNRIVAITAVVAVVYIGTPLLLTSFSDPGRRTYQPSLNLSLNEAMVLRGEIPPSADRTEKMESSPPPNIAWLMSFPNSGTSYTMRMIARTTRTLVATNYQKTESSKERMLQPVFHGQDEGPFWPDPRESKYKRPPTYVLTKTHCGSRCNDCGPNLYLRDFKSFQTVCSSGSKLETLPDGQEQVVNVQYNVTRVKKAVHLIRNPFDNVVSRFHLERHNMIRANDTEQLSLYPDSREGFRNFCQAMNEKWIDEVESRWMTEEIHMLRDVPCRDDFFRYIVWHNLAFTTTDEELHIPTFILHYEDYSKRFNETVSNLLKFLDLSQAAKKPYPFHKGHYYKDYFTAQERQAVRQATKIISTNTTWNNVMHYFWEY